MNREQSRWIRIGEWLFEVKSIRASKLDVAGKCLASANIQVNGDSVYIDSLLTASEEEFERTDMEAFKTLCQSLSVNSATFDRFKGDVQLHRKLSIPSANDHLKTFAAANG